MKYEFGLNLIPGIMFGLRSFNPDHNYNYSEHQVYFFCLCAYIIIEKVED